jgi:sortase A
LRGLRRLRLTRTPPSGSAAGPDSGPGRTVRLVLRAEHFLWFAGFLCLGIAGAAIVESHLYQSAENAAFDRALAAPLPGESDRTEEPRARIGTSSRPDAAVLGRIEIPRVGVRAIVREGIDAHTLGIAVGHIPGTARPGEPGNIGLAGHRDTFFRALRDVRTGDLLRLTTLSGSETYRVSSLSVVEPERTDVLRPTGGSVVTLVTCFPFDWIGAAPKRFIVAAVPAPSAAGTP